MKARRNVKQTVLWIGWLFLIWNLTACSNPVFYQPRPYQPEQLGIFSSLPGATRIEYEIAEGSQTAFYLPQRTRSENLPNQVWIMFGGIKSLALEWLPWLSDPPDPNIAFYLLDYPGYGLSEGVTRARRILLSSQAALDALAVHLNVDRKKIEKRLGILGHSLGTCAALQFAVKVDVQRIILVSPLTDLRDLTIYRYGWLVGNFLNLINPEVYANRERLDELAQRLSPPQIIIIHGKQDNVIPVNMGRELANRHPSITTYHELKGADHSNIFTNYMELIFESMGSPIQQISQQE